MKDLTKLTWNELRQEVEKCELQLRYLHDLPSIPRTDLFPNKKNKNKPVEPAEYMEAALEGVRSRLIAIHEVSNRILVEWQKYGRLDPAHPVELQQFSEIIQEARQLNCSIPQLVEGVGG